MINLSLLVIGIVIWCFLVFSKINGVFIELGLMERYQSWPTEVLRFWAMPISLVGMLGFSLWIPNELWPIYLVVLAVWLIVSNWLLSYLIPTFGVGNDKDYWKKLYANEKYKKLISDSALYNSSNPETIDMAWRQNKNSDTNLELIEDNLRFNTGLNEKVGDYQKWFPYGDTNTNLKWFRQGNLVQYAY
jgi:hypothetical protein